MEGCRVEIVTTAEELPEMNEHNVFHSSKMFNIYANSPRHSPYMVIVMDDAGRMVAHMLAVVRYRFLFFPPILYGQCRVWGEGDYEDSALSRVELFGLMLDALCRRVQRRVLFFEFSDLSQKMFGWKQFRRHSFFPVMWLGIHNSLHSRAPEERLSRKMRRRLQLANSRGALTSVVASDEDFVRFYRLLKGYYKSKFLRFFPGENFFRKMHQSGIADFFLTTHGGHAVGACACLYNNKDAFLWYLASRRKTYSIVYPASITIWNVIRYTYKKGCNHINFLDVGLPFHKNHYRELILRFGGKQVSTYRWFHVTVGWLNRLLSWIYRE